MSDLSERLAALSAEKRDLLLRRLQEQRQREQPARLALPTIVPDPSQRFEPFPLSDIQQAYWIGRSGLFELGNCGTNIYMEYEFSNLPARYARMFRARVELAIQRMVERHEVIRSIILPDGRQQVLAEVPPYRLPIEDLRGQASQIVEARLAQVRQRMCFERAPIDRWPLFEFRAHQLDGQRVRLHIRVDALLMDGTSRIMFLRELFHLLGNPAHAEPAPECSYRDYVLTWTAFQDSELYRRAREHWLRQLPTLPPAPDLPLAVEITHETPSRFVNWVLPLLDTEAWRRLRARAAQADISPSGIVTAAFVETLGHWSRSARFTIGLVGTYRPPLHPQIGALLGNFHTIYLLAVEDGPGTFEQRARRIQQQIITDLEYRSFSGFQMLRELNRVRGSDARAALPVLFNSVLEYSHASYQPAVDAPADAESASAAGGARLPNPRSVRSTRRLEYATRNRSSCPSWISKIELLTGALAGWFGARVAGFYRAHLVPTPQIREVEAGAYTPQIMLAPTVSETSAGELACSWLALENLFPAGMLREMALTYQQTLQRLADDERAWSMPRLLDRPVADRLRSEPVDAAPRTNGASPGRASRAPAPTGTPREALGRQITTIWHDLLGVEPIGLRDHFFELGGDSLSVVRLAARIRDQFDREFDVAAFFQNPTIEQLADLLEEAAPVKPEQPRLPQTNGVTQ